MPHFLLLFYDSLSLNALVLIMLSYGIASIPFGLVMTRLLGYGDVRKVGSGNIGATNVARMAGLPCAMAVYIADMLKGLIPVWFAPPPLRVPVAIACLFGHVFSIFLKFKGGKGVATACGVSIILFPWATLWAVIVWMIISTLFGYASLASLVAALTLTSIALLGHLTWENSFFPLVMFALLIYTHRENIVRLWCGKEHLVSPVIKK